MRSAAPELAPVLPQPIASAPSPFPAPEPEPNAPSFSLFPPESNRVSAGFATLLTKDVQRFATAPLGWDRSDWMKLGLGMLAVGGAMLLDEELLRSVERNSNGTTRRLADTVRPFGEEYSWGVLGAFYLAGRAFKDEKARAVAEDGLASSLIAAGVITPILKSTVGRRRPSQFGGTFGRGYGGTSFPSGHTTQAFVLASVIASHYDSTWIQVAAYGLAGLVGWSRMEHKAHYASDVLAGALIWDRGRADGGTTTPERAIAHLRGACGEPLVARCGADVSDGCGGSSRALRTPMTHGEWPNQGGFDA